jgi:hypothetical protein
MNSFRNGINDVLSTVGLFVVIVYAGEHWPLVDRVIRNAFLVVVGVWYVWEFFIKPFRAGLKGMIEPEKSLKPQNVFNVVKEVFSNVGLIVVVFYAYDHWPLASTIVSATFLAGCGVWYVWEFFVKPFRAGLKG